MELGSLFALKSSNNVTPPSQKEWDALSAELWRLDSRDELTVARAARALSHLGHVGCMALATLGNHSSEFLRRFLDTFDLIDDSKSDWRDLNRMLAEPGRGAKHVPESLSRLTRAAPSLLSSASTSAPSSRMSFTRVDVLAKNPKPLAWAIKGVLLRDSLAAVIGQPGSGKSFLAIDMALHVAAGRKWNGRKTIAGPVVYLAGEGVQNLSRRVVASSIRHGIDLTGVPLFVSSCAALMDQKPEVDKVLAAAEDIMKIQGTAPCLFVIDTLARSFSGRSENDASDMGNFIRGMDALRERHSATVLVIHHAGLSEGAEMRARGSSALLGALDVSMTLVSAKDGIRTLHMTKAKDFEEFKPMGFKLEPVDLPAAWNDEDGASSNSAVIVPTELNSETSGLTDRQRTAYDIAGELCVDGSRCEKKALARELQERGIVKDRFAASKLIGDVLAHGSLIADGKTWLIHCGKSAETLCASFDSAA